MKNIISFIIVLVLFYSNGYSQRGWFTQNPKPPFVQYNSVKFFDSNTGIIAGAYGLIIKTTNGGNSFNVYNSPLSYDIYKLSFINNMTGYGACGLRSNGNLASIIKTTNGGINWDVNFTANNSFIWYFNTIQFINENTGWAAGREGYMVKTTDAGDNWIIISNSFGLQDIICLRFKNQNEGWALTGENFGWRTTDGGDTWSQQTIPSASNASDIFFLNDNLGWIISTDHNISKTTDGGNNWQLKNGNGNTIYFINSNTGFISSSNCIEMTTNGGSTWNTVQYNFGVFAFSFPDALTGYGVSAIILKTSHGGNNWRFLSSPLTSAFNSVSFVNENTGWIAGTDSNKIFKTTNGGDNWIVQFYSSDNFNFSKIKFFNSNIGVGSGNNGHFGKTTNGGINWLISTININETYSSMSFIDSNTGWMVTGNSTLLKTTNCGLSWTYLTTPSIFRWIQFINLNTGWGNSQDNLYKTTNGGINWIAKESWTFYSWFHFFDGMNGEQIALNISPPTAYLYIRKTTNGSDSWYNVYSYTTGYSNVNYDMIFFTNNNHGIFSNSNILFTTIDGGSSWQTTSMLASHLNDVSFINDYTGWVVGNNGLILKTTTGGFVWVNNNSIKNPDNYLLTQNYPNPFNPITKIKYQIEKNSFVSIIVYDILGREIKNLVNEKQNAGTYEVLFDGNNLPSGIFFYRIQVENIENSKQIYSETKKMILLK